MINIANMSYELAFRAVRVFRTPGGQEHLVLAMGRIDDGTHVLVRGME